MELKDTIEMMISPDYKERFKAEFNQTQIRYNKLSNMLDNYYAGELPFNPVCPIELLQRQLNSMHEYLDFLIIRAKIEGIKLNGLFSK